VCEVLDVPSLHVGVIGDIHFIHLDGSKGAVFFLRTAVGGAFLFIVNKSPTLPGPYTYSRHDLPVVFLTFSHQELRLAGLEEWRIICEHK
jgi:hypothetical protein